MSCRASPSQPVSTNLVSSDQYNTLLARLDSEMLARSQLEADLAVARNEATLLHRRLAALGHDSGPPPPPPDSYPPSPPPTRQTPDHPTTLSPYRPNTPKHQSAMPSTDATKTQDKEILSHCSDISGVRTLDSNSINKSSSRKTSTNLLPGAVKKPKSKKERAAKVKIPGQSRYWTPEEHKLFLEALNKYGHKDLRSISAYVGTRNMTQVRTHSQKYFMRLMREAKRQNPAAKAEEAAQKEAKDTANASNTDGNNASHNGTSSSSSKPPRAPAESGEQNAREDVKDGENGDKYSVPNTCGMTLLCLVGQDTLQV